MRRTLAPLGLYGLLSVLFFGTGVLGHFSTHIVSVDQVDSGQFMWFYAWWPHALLHGLNPFVTHLMFAPDGYNLTWSTSMPLPAMLFAPLTLTAGPAVTWNVIQLLAPALTGWTTFLLCRHITGRVAPSLAGGFVFGFSPYMATHLTGGPYLALVMLLPLAILLVLKRLDGSLTPRGFVLWLWLLLFVQAGISTEVLATATMFAAIAMVLALALLAPLRAALLGVVRLSAAAYALTAVTLSPFLYYFFFGPNYAPTATFFSADLISPAIPPSTMELATVHGGFAQSARGSSETYLGLPLLLLLVLFAWRWRRERITWVLIGSLLAATIATFGSHLIVARHITSIPMPWLLLEHLPVVRYAIPLRLGVFALLPAAIIVALWLSRDRPPASPLVRWGLVGLVVLTFLPHFGDRLWHTDATDPPFFATGQYKHYLHRTDRVLTIPAMGANERWQADTKFGFTLATGYAGTAFPAGYTRFPIWPTLLVGTPPAHGERDLRRFLDAKRVSAIILDPSVPGPWRSLFSTLRVTPQPLGGILLYRLHGR